MKRWTIRSYVPRTGQRMGVSTESWLTRRGARAKADRLNAEVKMRSPHDPIYRIELVGGRSNTLRVRIKLWRAKRFRAKVAARLRKVAP